ncbi:uracil-DNA glycosylase family protein [Planktotalea sp.]|uniref:uracil-DNA glycosylase family protein n=1 Tax=Planktotalea sp. TaxID=2029877 RepID=UPI0025F65BEF|nr:uracil-DNA glycosylase family protein [Planktotalea sp.]
MPKTLHDLIHSIGTCRICEQRFALTQTGHQPRPVIWASADTPNPRILIVGQAPGARVQESGRPFTDPSGNRLRDWLGIDEATFYDKSKIAIAPMAFCFPGYNTKGADLPPPAICAKTWRKPLMDALDPVPLTLLIGGFAMKWHLGGIRKVTETVLDWKAHAPQVFPLPHPSWRNTAWLKKNPWFEADVLPVLRARIQEVLT